MEQFVLPYIFLPQVSIEQKKALAWHINSLTGEELLLPSIFLFSYSGIIAGLTIEHIEYILKNAPKDYKIELLKWFQNNYFMKDVLKIAKMMDEDLGENVTQNQNRIKKNFRFVSDNLEVFQF